MHESITIPLYYFHCSIICLFTVFDIFLCHVIIYSDNYTFSDCLTNALSATAAYNHFWTRRWCIFNMQKMQVQLAISDSA